MSSSAEGTLVILLVVFALAHGSDFWANKFKNKKIDCGVSPWSDWKCVGSSCARTRAIFRQPRNGGAACGALEESKPSNSKENPWDQRNVVNKLQSKFIVRPSRVLSFAGSKSSPQGSKTLQSRDLMIIADMSGSITKAEFHKMKVKLGEMIELICGTIGKTRQHNRIAVITFSSSIKLNFDFKTYFDLNAVKKAIMKIPQERRYTCTGNALHFAHTYMFDPKSGVRDATESVKEVLVLTDGKSNCGKKIAVEVKKLQVKAFVYALAIGEFSERGKKEIESMVSSPQLDHIFALSNFKNFFEMVDELTHYPDVCVPFELSR